MANEDGKTQREINNENNANNIKNAAEVAIATKNPYAVAAGTAIKAADKISGGRSTKALGKSMTMANKISPGGRKIQKMSNRLNESGASDKIGKAAAVKNRMGGNGKAGGSANKNGNTSLTDKMRSSKKNSGDSTKNSIFNTEDKKIELKIPLAIKIKLILIMILIIIIVFIFILITSFFSWLFDDVPDAGTATGGYYPVQCEEVNVIFTDKSNNYAVTGNGTYSLDDYVAGVISGEVGGFNNLEVYKEYAIAARTYFLKNEENCTIESSDRKQVFRETSNSLAKRAADDTSGDVLLNDDGKLLSTEYDAFCSIDKDSNYYTIKQKNQKIPVSWVDSQPGIISEWKQGTCAGNHGRGSSQWGSYYLATEKDYNYKQLLNYYYSDGDNNVSISNNSFTSSIANLDIKKTDDANNLLNQPIDSFLSSKGGSLDSYNDFIRNSVEKAGVGTRAGVVAGAVAMINYLYDNYNVKLPYYWGGSYQNIGIPSIFGTNVPSSPSPNGKRYQYISFDCSGFTSWAVKNGGFNIDRLNVTGFDNLVGSSNMCDVTDSSCIGQPGDFISYKGEHIKMIVSVDQTNNKYYVAESTGTGVIITTQAIHVAGKVPTRILNMESFYNNPNNINRNY